MNDNSRVAVVTGSSRGIGEAIAKEFANRGYNVVINSRDQEELSISKKEILKDKENSPDVIF